MKTHLLIYLFIFMLVGREMEQGSYKNRNKLLGKLGGKEIVIRKEVK